MAERAPRGPAPLPPGLSTDWPVPWQPLEGSDDGLLRHVELAALRGALALVSRMPESWYDPILGGAARLAKAVDRRHTEAARGFLRQAFPDLEPEELERRVVRAYQHLFRVVLDSERFSRSVSFDTIRDRYEVHWTPEAEAVRDARSGCVLVTAHLGSWEAGAAILPWIGFDPVYVVAKPPKSAPLARLMQAVRERSGVRVLPRRGAIQAAPAIVRAGGMVCLLLDQRANKRPVLAPFFGRPARCDRSAGVLIRRLRVPVVIASCKLADEPLHYRCDFHDVLRPEELEGADPVAISTRINRALEEAILRDPDQYYWIHDRYRDTPETFEEPVKELPVAERSGPRPAPSDPADAAEAGLRTGGGVSSNAANVSSNQGDPQ